MQLTLPFRELLGDLRLLFTDAWDILMYLGNFGGIFLLGFGALLWFSGFDTYKGRRMVLGGIIMIIAFSYLGALNPPFLGE
jgi:hypothetical protein